MFKLQFFARWGSCANLRDVVNIPAVKITTEVAGSFAASSQAVLSLSALLGNHVRDAQDQVVTLKIELKSLQRQLHPSFVRNTVTGLRHEDFVSGTQYPPASWKTVSDWKL